MDERDIEIFQELVKLKNVTRAAEHLYTTQSSVTKRIQKMEEELGCRLFIRTRKGIHLTPAAEKILPELTSIQTTMQNIRNYTASADGVIAGTLQMGVSVNFARYYLPDILRKYMTDYPQVRINISAGQSTHLYRQLQAHEISAAIVRGDFSWEEGNILLSQEAVCLVMSEANAEKPLGELPRITRRSDAGFEQEIREWCGENSIEESASKLQVNDISACLAMVENGIGWAILPEICLRNFHGVRIPLKYKNGTGLTRTTRILYRDEYYELPQVKLFIDSVAAGNYTGQKKN